MTRAVAALLILLAAPAARAQEFDGHFSTLFSVMPDVDSSAGRQAVSELRTRLFLEGLWQPRDAVHLRAGVFVDGLVADRQPLGAPGTTGVAVLQPADVYLEIRRDAFDVRAGIWRVVWGRLDEFQPTDVVNPLDVSRFVLEGRSDARLPVALVRGRVHLPGGSTAEAIVVPVFRGGAFDQLDEETSPFRLSPPGEIERREPAVAWRNLQGGGRFTSTVGRLDWGVSAWRGFEPFPAYVPVLPVPDPLALVLPRYIGMFPRFTMVGADFETVRGPWGLRGEFAWFDSATPRSFEGGLGADRRAGNYRVALNAVVSHGDDTDVTLVAWAERTFARETWSVRLLGVSDPSDETAFVRGIAAWSVRDNVSLELSAGWLTSGDAGPPRSGSDVLALLSHRDFVYARVKMHF